MEDVRGVFQNRLAPKEAGKKRINACFEELLSGKSVASVLMNEELQACMIMNRKNLESAVAAVTTARLLTKQLKFAMASGEPGSPNGDIAAWLNQNLLRNRPFGAPQLFLTGPTGIGKSHLLKTLEPGLRIFYLNMMEDWMDGYDDDLYDLIAIEEFHSQKTLQFMNQLLDGQPMPYRVRNGNGGKLKRKNLPIIITSNYGLSEIYPKVDAMRKATFVRRVTEVYSAERLNIHVQLVPVSADTLESTEVLSPERLVPDSPYSRMEAQAHPGPGNIIAGPGVPPDLYQDIGQCSQSNNENGVDETYAYVTEPVRIVDSLAGSTYDPASMESPDRSA